MSSLPYDIVILPADELAYKAINLSERLTQYNTLFTLQDGTYYPHTSLYMTQLKVADLDRVKSILADIAATTSPLNLIATRYDQAEGYIDADYARTETLDRLQMAVVDAINPIRDGLRENDKARLLTTTGKVHETSKSTAIVAWVNYFGPI
jgi:diphthamide synthase subunit DPH2